MTSLLENSRWKCNEPIELEPLSCVHLLVKCDLFLVKYRFLSAFNKTSSITATMNHSRMSLLGINDEKMIENVLREFDEPPNLNNENVRALFALTTLHFKLVN
jgi:hypothetical protein